MSNPILLPHEITPAILRDLARRSKVLTKFTPVARQIPVWWIQELDKVAYYPFDRDGCVEIHFTIQTWTNNQFQRLYARAVGPDCKDHPISYKHPLTTSPQNFRLRPQPEESRLAERLEAARTPKPPRTRSEAVQLPSWYTDESSVLKQLAQKKNFFDTMMMDYLQESTRTGRTLADGTLKPQRYRK